jgi:hypothetical protein
MIKDIYKLAVYSIILVVIFSVLNCQNDYPPSIYNEDESYKADPVITSIVPDSAFAGVDTLEIYGDNFSDNPDEISVFFNGQKGKVVSSTMTQVNVIPASLISDSIKIQLNVFGALSFAEYDSYKLKSAVLEIYNFEEYEKPYGVTTDIEGNIYFSLVSFDGGKGIKRITQEGMLEDFLAKAGESYYTDLKFGADLRVYGARSPLVRAIFAGAQGGSPAAIPVPDNSARLITLDFDNNLNIWTGGLGGKIYKISPDGSDIKSFPFEPDISAIRYYDGYLYTAAKLDSVEAIWRFSLVSSDSLGQAEEYFRVSENLPGYSVNSITFTSDGTLLLGTDAELADENSMIAVLNGGSFYPWYPGVIVGPVINMAWDTGNYLYYIRGEVDEGDTQTQTILRVNMKTTGAPYYGRD